MVCRCWFIIDVNNRTGLIGNSFRILMHCFKEILFNLSIWCCPHLDIEWWGHLCTLVIWNVCETIEWQTVFLVYLVKYALNFVVFISCGCIIIINPDSKVNGANMGPTWVLLAPDGPHVGPLTLLSGNRFTMCLLEIVVDYVDLVVHYLRKAVKLNHSLTHSLSGLI